MNEQSKIKYFFSNYWKIVVLVTLIVIFVGLGIASIVGTVKTDHIAHDMEFAKQMEVFGCFKEDIHLINFRLEYPQLYIQWVLSFIGIFASGVAAAIPTALLLVNL